MGRGRAKAKQTKVARELKYSSPSTDFQSLQKELGGSTDSHRDNGSVVEREPTRYDDDDYEDWRR